MRSINKSLIATGVLSVLLSATTAHALTLGITADGRFFTIDGVPTYLNGISYYAAQSISTASFRTQDLDDMVADGLNWIRVWAYWDIPGENCGVTTQTGTVREPYMTRLKTLITEANSRGIIVDVSMRHDSGSSIAPSNLSQHVACAQTIATQLLPYRNVYIDISNERDVGDSRFVSISDCGTIIDAIKAIDADRLCTASGVPTSQTDMNNYKVQGHLDFITPHLCRDASCPAATFGTVKQFIYWMNTLGFRIPVHMQEPFRRTYNSFAPTEDDFYRDDTGAKVAEAAGWCLHNGSTFGGAPYRSFNMNDASGRLYAQLDSVEINTTNNIFDRIGSNSIDVRKYQTEYPEQLFHQVGRRESAVWSASVPLDPPGYLAYGPYLDTVPAGYHRVDWRLSIDNITVNNEPIAILDIVSNSSVLASRTLIRQEFFDTNVLQTFSLNFNSAGEVDLEFRVNWLDKAYIQCDWVQLTINGGNQTPVPPVIAPVIPIQIARPNVIYHQQMNLQQGYPPPTWSLPQSPPGASINGNGLVSWTPTVAHFGNHDFTAEANNSQGTDSESWVVRVVSVMDFDADDDVDVTDFGHLQRCFSGDLTPYAAGCGDADANGDGDVDTSDFNAFLPCLAGANQIPGC